MPGEKADVVMFGPKPMIVEALTKAGLQLHKAWAAPDQDAFVASIAAEGARHRGGGRARADRRRPDGTLSQARDRVELRRRLRSHRRQMGRARKASWSPTRPTCSTRRWPTPRSGCCSARYASCRRPSAICAPATGRSGDYQLTPSLRDRTVGIVGMGRIGKAIARRSSHAVPVVYHPRRQNGVPYRHYPNLIDMARDVDMLIVDRAGRSGDQEPGQCRGAEGARAERHPDQRGARLGGGRGGADPGAAGQDHPVRRPRRVRDEPNVPAELIAMENVVLLPHVGSASEPTRRAMDSWWPTTSSPGSPARGRSRRFRRRR